MKITKARLREIIQEELETAGPEAEGEIELEPQEKQIAHEEVESIEELLRRLREDFMKLEQKINSLESVMMGGVSDQEKE